MPSHVRHAAESDLDALTAIETAADVLFEPLFGASPASATPARERLRDPGFILVAAEEEDGPPVGFAHVREIDAHTAHLDQLSVHPRHARRGHGRALLEAAADEAAGRGAAELSLRTYADIPWNAPFYASARFEEAPIPETLFHRELTEHEQRLGLPRHGRRVHMHRELGLRMAAEEFERLVVDELDRLPDEIVDGLENVVFVV